MGKPEDIVINPEKQVTAQENEVATKEAVDNATEDIMQPSFRDQLTSLEARHDGMEDLCAIRASVVEKKGGLSIGERMGLFFTFNQKEKENKRKQIIAQKVSGMVDGITRDTGSKLLKEKSDNENANRSAETMIKMFEGMSDEERQKYCPNGEYDDHLEKIKGEREERENNIINRQKKMDSELEPMLDPARREQARMAEALSDFEGAHKSLSAEIGMVRQELNKHKHVYETLLAPLGKDREDEIAHMTVAREYKDLQEKLDDLMSVEADLRKRKNEVAIKKGEIDRFVGRLSGIGKTAAEQNAERVAASKVKREVNNETLAVGEVVGQQPFFGESVADDYNNSDRSVEVEEEEGEIEENENEKPREGRRWVGEIIKKDMSLVGLKPKERMLFRKEMDKEAIILGMGRELSIDDMSKVLDSLLKKGILEERFPTVTKFSDYKRARGRRKLYVDKIVDAIKKNEKMMIENY